MLSYRHSYHAGNYADVLKHIVLIEIFKHFVKKDKGFDYTRSSNPTRQVLEENLAAIERANHAVSFASGMAAVDACLKLLASGDHVVCGDDIYGGVTRYFDNVLSYYGLQFTYVDTTEPEAVRSVITPKTRMLWIETPTNPLLKVSDLEAMVSIARENNILLGVDSTFATPVFLRPLDFGADIVMHSTTKYLAAADLRYWGVVAPETEREKAKRERREALLVAQRSFDAAQDAAPQLGPQVMAALSQQQYYQTMQRTGPGTATVYRVVFQ